MLHVARGRGANWWVNRSTAIFPPMSLSCVISGLCGALGRWRLRGLLGQMLMMAMYRRLRDVGGKMERLAARFAAGRLWRRGAVVRAVGQAEAAVSACQPVRVWPCRFGWLVRLAASEAAGYGAQLRFVLGQPEMVALLIAAPQAARLLQPICRMLAVETSLLRPCADGAVESAPEEVACLLKKRVRRPRRCVEPERIALPLGVLSAARRQGFGRSG